MAKNTRKQDFAYSKNTFSRKSVHSRFSHGSNPIPPQHDKVNFANLNTENVCIIFISYLFYCPNPQLALLELWSNFSSQPLWKINSRNSDRQNLNWCLEKFLSTLLSHYRRGQSCGSREYLPFIGQFSVRWFES